MDYVVIMVLYTCGLLFPLSLYLVSWGQLFLRREKNELPRVQMKEEETCPTIPLARHVTPVFVITSLLTSLCCSSLIVSFIDDGPIFADELFHYSNMNFRPYEKYESLSKARSQESYEYVHLTTNASTVMSDDYDEDYVLVYHTAEWSNVLTEDALVAACLIEKDLEAISDCGTASDSGSSNASDVSTGIGDDINCDDLTCGAVGGDSSSSGVSRHDYSSVGRGMSSVLPAILNDSCVLRASFNDTLFFLATDPAAKPHVKDSISGEQRTVTSEVLVSYLPECFFRSQLTRSDIEGMVERAAARQPLTSPVEVTATVAQKSMISSSLHSALCTDSVMAALCGVVALVMLAMVVPCRLAVATASGSIVCSLLLSLGGLLIHGYDYYTLHCLVVIPLLLLVSVVMLLTFSRAWEMAYTQENQVQTSAQNEDKPQERDRFLERVLCHAYCLTWRTLHCYIGVSVCFSLAISLYPIVAISQTGICFFFSVLCFYVLFHLWVIPAFVVYAKWQFSGVPSGQSEHGDVEMVTAVTSVDGEESLGDHEESRDRVSAVLCGVYRPSSLRRARPPLQALSPAAATSPSSPPQSRGMTSSEDMPVPILTKQEMYPLATDTVAPPTFSICQSPDHEAGWCDVDEIDFDDGVSEFTKESGLYASSYDAPADFFQQENPSNVRDSNVGDRDIAGGSDRESVEPELSTRRPLSITINVRDTGDVMPPLTSSGHQLSTVASSHCYEPCRHRFCVTPPARVQSLFFAVVLITVVLFFVIVNNAGHYSTSYRLLSQSEHLSAFMRTGARYKTAFYSFSGSYGSLLPVSPSDMAAQMITSGAPVSEVSSSFEVNVCYGLGSRRDILDMPQRFAHSSSVFGQYVMASPLTYLHESDGPKGILADMQALCSHIANRTQDLFLSGGPSTVLASCLHTQLLSTVTTNNINMTAQTLFDVIYRWMTKYPHRRRRVGVVPAVNGSGSGNFGPSAEYNMTWLCEAFSGNVPEVSEFGQRSVFAEALASDWERAVEESVGLKVWADQLPVLVSAEEWMPVEVGRVTQEQAVYAVLCLVGGSFAVISVITWDVKAAVVIQVSSIFLTLLSLLFRCAMFRATITAMHVLSSCMLFTVLVLSQVFFSWWLQLVAVDEEPRVGVRVGLSVMLAGISVLFLFSESVLLRLLGEHCLVGCLLCGLHAMTLLPLFVDLAASTELNPINKYFRPRGDDGNAPQSVSGSENDDGGNTPRELTY